MPVILNKVHLLTGELTSSGKIKTNCGKVGWEERVSDEYSDEQGFIFEATAEHRKVTCKTCRVLAPFHRGWPLLRT